MGIEIGNNTMISLGAKLDVRRGKIIIGDDCLITWGTVILSHDASQLLAGNIKKSQATTIIENGVFIGVNSVVLPGVRIGEKSIVGAGSVVTKDITPHTLVAGNPATVIRRLMQ
jgi:acetyltransferase-like isoleucine patch superfamily enzyme